MAMRRSLRAGVIPIVRAPSTGPGVFLDFLVGKSTPELGLAAGNSSKSSPTNICVPYVFFFPRQAERKLI